MNRRLIIVERFGCRRARGGGWRGMDSLPPSGADAHRRAADREAGSRRDSHGVEAAETPATADCDHRHQRRHRGHRLSHALWHPAARRRRRRGAAGNGAGAGEAVSGAQGRAAGDGRGVRCAASGRRRLCHRPGHEPRRRPGGPRMAQEPGGQGRDDHRRVRRSQGRRRGRAAGRQTGDDPLVLRRRSCATSIPRSTTSRTGGWWSTRAWRRRRGSPRPCRCRSR